MKYDTLIFDLDGTLWDALVSTKASADIIAKKYNTKEVSLEQVKKAMGKTFKESAEIYFPDIDVNLAMSYLNEIVMINSIELSKNGAQIYEGVIDTLKRLKEKYKLVLISNCGIKYLDAFLDYYNLRDVFDDYMAAASYKINKSTAIRLIIDTKGYKNPVYIGDTLKDYESATTAGIDFIQALYGFGKDLNTMSINKFSELESVLEG